MNNKFSQSHNYKLIQIQILNSKAPKEKYQNKVNRITMIKTIYSPCFLNGKEQTNKEHLKLIKTL